MIIIEHRDISRAEGTGVSQMLTIEPAYIKYPVISTNYKHYYYYSFFYLCNYYSVPIPVSVILDRAVDHVYKVLNA